MNATVNHLLGGDDDPMGAYIKGYIAGFGFGAVYCGACAIAAIYEVTALVHMGMFGLLSAVSINELALALCAGAVGNNKAALVHTVLAVLSIGGAMYELSLTGIISVTGPKGTVEVDIRGKANKVGSTSIPDLSNKAVKHPMNDHMPARYAKQLQYMNKETAEQYLSYKTFFNSNWTDEQVRVALTTVRLGRMLWCQEK